MKGRILSRYLAALNPANGTHTDTLPHHRRT